MITNTITKPDIVTKQNEQVNVSLDVVWHGSAGKYNARMSEISMDGCFIDSMGQENLGETIIFNVHLPSGIWVTLQGKVVYQEYPIGFEVRFTDLTEENRKLIVQVVAAHGGREAQQILRKLEERKLPEKTASCSRRILVADDEAMTLRMLTVIIEEEGALGGMMVSVFGGFRLQTVSGILLVAQRFFENNWN